MDAPIRTPIIQVSFATQTISFNMSDKRTTVNDFVWGKMEEKIDPLWHSDNDQIEYFFYYNDETYFCQKKKLVYDFETKSQYWKGYIWKEATNEQAKELCEFFTTFSVVQQDLSTRDIQTKISALQEKQFYFDREYYLKVAERNNMLTVSDWRVLPDAPQKVEGESQMWVKWRSYLREEVIKKPTEFENNLEFYKYVTNLKYPIDPRKYLELYPNQEVEYMKEDDESQWSAEQNGASTDYIHQNIKNIIGLMEGYGETSRMLSKQILDIAKSLEIEECFPGLDLSSYSYVDKPIIDPDRKYIKPTWFPSDFEEGAAE